MWILNENRKTVWHLKAMTVSSLCQRRFVIQPGTTSDRAHLRICLPYAYQKSGMCARLLPWRTGSITIKGRNSSTLASSNILKQSKVYSRGGRGARLFAWEWVFVCACGCERGFLTFANRKWEWSVCNFSCELYLIHYGEAEACLSGIRLLSEEMPN